MRDHLFFSFSSMQNKKQLCGQYATWFCPGNQTAASPRDGLLFWACCKTVHSQCSPELRLLRYVALFIRRVVLAEATCAHKHMSTL